MQYVVFDVETELIYGPLNLDLHIPGITIAATLTGDDELRTWYERSAGGQATGEALSAESAQALVQYLMHAVQVGYTLVTWNGAGFDLRVLAQASGLWDECVDLAWRHIDLMFWLHCQKGFSVQLAKAAEAVGSGKTAGLSGADAPRLWAQGQYEQVEQYVIQDVRALGAVYEAAIRTRGLQWVTARGTVSKARGYLLSVRDSYKLPPPDTSWMRQAPWPRKKFVGWMLARGQGDSD